MYSRACGVCVWICVLIFVPLGLCLCLCVCMRLHRAAFVPLYVSLYPYGCTTRASLSVHSYWGMPVSALALCVCVCLCACIVIRVRLLCLCACACLIMRVCTFVCVCVCVCTALRVHRLFYPCARVYLRWSLFVCMPVGTRAPVVSVCVISMRLYYYPRFSVYLGRAPVCVLG